MRWWDKINVFKEKATGLGTSIWQKTTLPKVVNEVGQFSYRTINHLFEQISVAPKVIYSSVWSPKTRKVTGQLIRIGLEDLAPLVLVNYANQLVQMKGKTYLDSDEPWLSTNTMLQMSLILLETANWLYTIRKRTQLGVRLSIVAIEASRAFSKERVTPPMTICLEEKCTTLRFLKGSFRDFIAYWSTEAAISLIGYIPMVGGGMAGMLAVYHRGRYVMTLLLPDLCSRHQEQYLREYTEWCLAHGLGHLALTELTTHFLESVSGIPKQFYKGAVQQFLLITQTSIAAHMPLPSPIKKSNRNLPDPVAIYESAIGFIFDTVVLGLKKQIPILLKQKGPSLPWEKLKQGGIYLWNNPVAQAIKPLVIPRMLRSSQAFINDPVIPWSDLKETTVEAIVNIECIKNKWLVRIATLSPKKAAKVTWLIFGTPRSVVELLLKMMGNQEIMNKLGDLRRSLGGMHQGDPPPIPESEEALPLRGQEQTLPDPIKKIGILEEDPKLLMLPEEVLSPIPHMNNPLEYSIHLEEEPSLKTNLLISTEKKPIKSTEILVPRQRMALKEISEENLFDPEAVIMGTSNRKQVGFFRDFDLEQIITSKTSKTLRGTFPN